MAGDSMESNFVSMKPAVEFIDVLDQYSYNENLCCTYKFNEFSPQEGDRVAIFKLGWNFVKDYVVFEWAPISKDKENSVTFSRHILPKNNEIYQICYINGENVLYGASSPFQFAAEVSPVMTQSGMSMASGEDTCDRTNILDRQDELTKLKEENEMLRATLKVIVGQQKGGSIRNYDTDISNLWKATDNLQEAFASQQKEINMLKTKITNGAEEYKKLYLEKVKVEKKYDKLKNKLENDGKNVSEIVNFDIGDLKSIPPFPFSK